MIKMILIAWISASFGCFVGMWYACAFKLSEDPKDDEENCQNGDTPCEKEDA